MGKLTDIFIKNLKSGPKPVKYADGGGLYLVVTPTGGKLWRYKYDFEDRERLLSIGRYPIITLADARERLLAAKRELAAGRNPAAEKQEAKAARRAAQEAEILTFEKAAGDYFQTRQGVYSEKSNLALLGRLKKHIFPALGAKPIADISATELLEVLTKVKATGREEMASRLRQYSGQIFKFAMRKGWAKANPASALEGIPELKKTGPQKHQRAVRTPGALGRLLADMETYNDGIVGAALRLQPYVFLRSSELCRGRWMEVDFDDALWRIPAERMKAKADHLVPLARQVMERLETLRQLTSGNEFMFPSWSGGQSPITPESLWRALNRLGYGPTAFNGGHTPHGFRSAAATLLREKGYPGDWVEIQLAHAERDKIVAAYNHALYVPQRREMMQAWADYLDGLRAQAVHLVEPAVNT
jgi:integrase